MRKIGHRVSGSVEDFVRDLIDGNEEAELLGLEVVEGEVNRSCTKLTTLANDDNDQEMAWAGGIRGRRRAACALTCLVPGRQNFFVDVGGQAFA